MCGRPSQIFAGAEPRELRHQMAVRLNRELELDLNDATSETVLRHVAWKKEVLKAKKLFETSSQAPSPSKDYCQLIVTEKGVVMRRWKITLRNASSRHATAPTEDCISYEDFLYDTQRQKDVEYIFGREVAYQVKRILGGTNDELSKLPTSVMVNIAAYLDLQSISSLSQVNKHLKEVCSSDQLWEKLYLSHQGKPAEEVISLAKSMGWRQVFFMNKLHLQKELSRRRRILNSPLH